MFDEDPEAAILYSCGDHLVTQSELQISFSADNDRKTLPTDYEQAIDTVWAGRLAENPTIWNGSKFRLGSVTSIDGGGVCWHLGLTSYKEFLGTNFSPHADKLIELGRQMHGNSQAFLSDALGVAAILVTSDKRVVLMKRSNLCAEATGLYDVPGGHPEPQEIAGPVDIKEMDRELFTVSAVCEEVYSSIVREVRDEVNLPTDSLSEPLLLGLSVNKLSHGRLAAVFLIRTSKNHTQVEDMYRKGTQAEAEETTNIKMLDQEEMITVRQSNIWHTLAPNAKGCFLLYLNYLSLQSSS